MAGHQLPEQAPAGVYWANTSSNGLEDALAAAKAQIAERAYAASLEAVGIAPERIRELGIAFQGKRCIVGGRLTRAGVKL